MKNIKLFDRRLGFSLGALSILFGTMAPAIVPAFASADSQITNRSVKTSSSIASATSVSYTIKFTPSESTGRYLGIEFCSNTPLIDSGCTAASGMALNLSDAEVLTGGTVDATHHGANYAIVDLGADVTSGTPVTLTITGVQNPDNSVTSYYAKLALYQGTGGGKTAAEGAIDGATAINTGDSNLVDDGSVALSINDQIGVQAAVLESLQFCVYGDPANTTHAGSQFDSNASGYLSGLSGSTNGPDAGCDDTAHAGANSPSVQLGQSSDIGNADNVIALDAADVSYAADWAQLSTNANTGAVVYLKTNNTCVGLSRDGGTTCQIGGPDNGDGFGGGSAGHALSAGTAGFGVEFGAAQSTTSGTASGTLTANADYSSKFAMLNSHGTAATDANGSSLPVDTTSTYGGYVFGSNQVPVANKDMPFSMAAAIANNTPSGLYKATLDLIAVGTF